MLQATWPLHVRVLAVAAIVAMVHVVAGRARMRLDQRHRVTTHVGANETVPQAVKHIAVLAGDVALTKDVRAVAPVSPLVLHTQEKTRVVASPTVEAPLVVNLVLAAVLASASTMDGLIGTLDVAFVRLQTQVGSLSREATVMEAATPPASHGFD
jgi:hypothetical protein